MNYKTAIFDLDGTITDSGPGIMNAIRYAVRSADCRMCRGSAALVIGPPLKNNSGQSRAVR